MHLRSLVDIYCTEDSLSFFVLYLSDNIVSALILHTSHIYQLA
jgi:hypothetical protein